MHYVIYIKPFSIHSYPQCVYRHWYPLCTEPFSCCAVSVLACACSTHEESCHMFQQVPVTRAPCFEALSLTVSPLENRGWLTCKQPCQGKTLKSLVGESAAEHYLHCDPWRTLSNSQREKSIWRGLQLQPRRANAIGHRADTSTFSMGGGGGGGGDLDWGSDLSRRALCAAARLCHRCRNVGGLLRLGGGMSEADFLLRWQDDEEEVKNRMSG